MSMQYNSSIFHWGYLSYNVFIIVFLSTAKIFLFCLETMPVEYKELLCYKSCKLYHTTELLKIFLKKICRVRFFAQWLIEVGMCCPFRVDKRNIPNAINNKRICRTILCSSKWCSTELRWHAMTAVPFHIYFINLH